MKSIFVFLSACPAHWLPACWGSVNESGKRSSLYYCRQPAQPHSFPSQGRPPLQPSRWPHFSVPAKRWRQSSSCFVAVTVHRLPPSHLSLRHKICRSFVTSCPWCFRQPDTSFGTNASPNHTEQWQDTGWWEEFVSEVCCNPPDRKSVV